MTLALLTSADGGLVDKPVGYLREVTVSQSDSTSPLYIIQFFSIVYKIDYVL
jgi:hypothetical protein